MCARPRIAVVSPFLDKRHGTERCIAEQVERLARDHGYEVHIYSQRVEDIPGVEQFCPSHATKTKKEEDASRAAADKASAASGLLVWHRISDIPGPHVLRYLWWLLANQFRRWKDRRFGGLGYDLVYSPGVNCFDADVISVHVVFAGLRRVMINKLDAPRGTLRTLPRLVHRRAYYRLAAALEGWAYACPRVTLVAVSRKTANDLRSWYGCTDQVSVVYHGLDTDQFNPRDRMELRQRARRELSLPGHVFAALLVGNDWTNKGLQCLLEALAKIGRSDLRVLVVGEDDPTPFGELARQKRLADQVLFLPPRADVQYYYAAADAYVAPSLNDAFSLPPAEAMACGLPTIASRQAGVSEIITHGRDGFILEDASSAGELAGLIRALLDDPELRAQLGEQAAHTARQYTWSRNAEEMKLVFEGVRRYKAEKRSGRGPAS